MTARVFHVRRARPEEANRLALLAAEIGHDDPPERLAIRLDRILESGSHQVFVVEHEETVLGWAQVGITLRLASPTSGEIGGLVVTKTARGQGAGRALVDSCATWARQRGAERLRVRSQVRRRQAHAFFEKLGFQQQKTQHVFARKLELS